LSSGDCDDNPFGYGCSGYNTNPGVTETAALCGNGCDDDCSGGDCVPPPVCTSESYSECYDGDVYWYDSCDNRGEKRFECDDGNACTDDSCPNGNTACSNVAVDDAFRSGCSGFCCNGVCDTSITTHGYDDQCSSTHCVGYSAEYMYPTAYNLHTCGTNGRCCGGICDPYQSFVSNGYNSACAEGSETCSGTSWIYSLTGPDWSADGAQCDECGFCSGGLCDDYRDSECVSYYGSGYYCYYGLCEEYVCSPNEYEYSSCSISNGDCRQRRQCNSAGTAWGSWSGCSYGPTSCDSGYVETATCSCSPTSCSGSPPEQDCYDFSHATCTEYQTCDSGSWTGGWGSCGSPCSCDANYRDCYGDYACETYIRNNDDHCGACGNACGECETCSGTTCVPLTDLTSCSSGSGRCCAGVCDTSPSYVNSGYDSSCRTSGSHSCSGTSWSVTYYAANEGLSCNSFCGECSSGSCDYSCSGSESCESDVCVPTSCSGSSSQSCSVTNGDCTQYRTCNSGTWSSWGSCTQSPCSCDSNYGNCDGSWPNGCEEYLVNNDNHPINH